MTADELYDALKSKPITDKRLKKARLRYASEMLDEVLERLRLEGYITRAQAAQR